MKTSSCNQDLPTLRQVLSDIEHPLSILELGSGCGIVGIALAQSFSCTVTLTDLPGALDLLQANIDLAKPVERSCLHTSSLDWSHEVWSYRPGEDLDLIVMADCTYNPDTSPELVLTLSRLCQTHPEALVVVSLKRRHASEAIFFELMSNAGLAQLDHLRMYDLERGRPDNETEIGQMEIYTYRLKAS